MAYDLGINAKLKLGNPMLQSILFLTLTHCFSIEPELYPADS